MNNKNILVLGATGFVGSAFVRSLINEGFKVSVVGRSLERINKLFSQQVEAFRWNQFSQGNLNDKDFDCVINLAGASIADKRWTSKRKEEILNSRVIATQTAARYCLKKKITLLNASAVGIYGHQNISKNGLGPALEENAPRPVDNADDFLSSVCRDWEEETEILKKSGIRVVNLRFGVILGKEGGALKKMAIPFHLFAGGPIGSGYQAVPWVSLDDVVRAIEYVMEHDNISGPVNVVAPHCLTQKELGHALGKALKRPSFVPTPGIILKIILGQMAEELLLNGQHVYPKKLIDEGFEFKHPTIEKVFKEIYG
jgi:uncharacterized protein (TIGR01777 family)